VQWVNAAEILPRLFEGFQGVIESAEANFTHYDLFKMDKSNGE
jgi:hypothetical protein